MAEKISETDPYADLHLASDRALQTASRWAQTSRNYPNGYAAKLLAAVLEDKAGLDFTVEFVDGVVRPEDLRVAARNLSQLTKEPPKFLPPYLSIPASVGGQTGFLAPEIVIPAARKVFSQLVGDLVLDVTDKKLGPSIKKLSANGSRLNINLLGEAVLGDAEAEKRLQDVSDLLHRDDVDYVSVKVSAVTGPQNPWDHAAVVDQAVEALLPLYQYAAESPTPKFINLDMEEYHDVDLTVDVYEKLLSRPELKDLEAGIVVQTYLPDALPLLERLDKFAAARVADGGAPIKVRLVKGANLAMESVASAAQGWPLVTWESKQATDANNLRVLNWALDPARTSHMRFGVASHNFFTLATAWELAGLRGVRDAVDIEMLSGMAEPQAEAVRQEVGNLLLYVPVVRPSEFDVAIAYLVRRLEENSAPENFMSNIFDIGEDPAVFALEESRYKKALQQLVREGDRRCHPNRQQDRRGETAAEVASVAGGPGEAWTFTNTPNSDPSLQANREWAEAIVQRIPASTLGEATVEKARVASVKELSKKITKAKRAGAKWGKLPAAKRAEKLHQLGIELALRRAELIEVAASELGKTIDQTDVEVSEAIDFAHYYAEQALELERVPGAEFHPSAVTSVIPPWNFPIAIPLGGVASALASGSAVMFKPATPARRCGAVLMEAIAAAGISPDLVQLVVPDNRAVAGHLVRDERVERVILTGSSETAEMFLDWRPDLTLLAETSGKNSIIVTPSADLDLAAKDVVESAFSHAGQKCSAASLAILVGSAGTSQRFRDQLLDATRSLNVDWAVNPSSQVSPLSELPGEKLRRGLTQLEPGQSWAVQPRQLDDTDRLWSPGVRANVQPGSEFHLVEYFGPILGIIRVDTLEEAVEVQNATDFGLTAGLQSLDPAEVQYWLDHVHAGNLYINRGITGAIVRRQPFGGWKSSAVGPGAKAGGPNYLFGLGSFTPVETLADGSGGDDLPAAPERDPQPRKPQLQELLEVARALQTAGTLTEADVERIAAAALNAESACEAEFDVLSDPSDLWSEKNILRYLPARSVLRAEEGTSLADLLCVAAAAVATGEYVPAEGGVVRLAAGQMHPTEEPGEPHMVLTTANALPLRLVEWARKYGFGVTVEDQETFQRNLDAAELDRDGRVRLLGGSRAELMDQLSNRVDVAIWDGPATTAGRVEVLPFVHEQSVTLTAHRFGTPSALAEEVL